jgi:hypothetical protein
MGTFNLSPSPSMMYADLYVSTQHRKYVSNFRDRTFPTARDVHPGLNLGNLYSISETTKRDA